MSSCFFQVHVWFLISHIKRFVEKNERFVPVVYMNRMALKNDHIESHFDTFSFHALMEVGKRYAQKRFTTEKSSSL